MVLSPKHSLTARKSTVCKDSFGSNSKTLDFNFKRWEIKTSVKQYRNVLMKNKYKIKEYFGVIYYLFIRYWMLSIYLENIYY